MRSFAKKIAIGTRTFACWAVLAGAAYGQTPGQTAARPTFEGADIHVSAIQNDMRMQGGAFRDGRYELRRASMLGLIGAAYGVDADKVSGGPSWLVWDLFDVIAKAPPTTSPEAVKLMLQALLADRFKLVLHKDTKPQPAFVLSMGPGKSKLKEAAGTGASGCQRVVQPPQPGAIPSIVYACRNVTMEAFAPVLRGLATEYLPNPVVDSTGLNGAWDFDLKWTNKNLLAAAGTDGISVLDAVDKQLGLKLEAQKVPMAVFVVDSMSEKPSPNPPNTATLLPARVVEFEVASIRPSVPGAAPAPQALFSAQAGGRLDRPGLPMSLMLQEAWDLNPQDMASLPKWVDSARFDIVAKAPDSAIASGTDLYTDDLRLMYRALLVDRFKMVAHYEDRPTDAYTLVAAKPKLTKADPSNRTACTAQNAGLSRRLVCQNITMAQFAERLPKVAGQYTRHPVLDATGIEGAWDFTLTFSQVDPATFTAALAAAGAAGTASDPSGAVSLFDAVEKQLGLKLEKTKRPVPVLVIDHLEEKPADN